MRKTSYLLLALSIVVFIVYNSSESYVDNNGILIEHFYLLPIGYFLLFLSLILFISKHLICRGSIAQDWVKYKRKEKQTNSKANSFSKGF